MRRVCPGRATTTSSPASTCASSRERCVLAVVDIVFGLREGQRRRACGSVFGRDAKSAGRASRPSLRHSTPRRSTSQAAFDSSASSSRRDRCLTTSLRVMASIGQRRRACGSVFGRDPRSAGGLPSLSSSLNAEPSKIHFSSSFRCSASSSRRDRCLTTSLRVMASIDASSRLLTIDVGWNHPMRVLCQLPRRIGGTQATSEGLQTAV